MRYLFLMFTILYSLVAMAQENTDTIYSTEYHDETEMEIKISKSDFERLKKEKDIAVTNYNSLQDKYNELLKKDSVKTSQLLWLNSEYPVLRDKYEVLLKTQEIADKRLLNTAANFLYIPYEAFGVEKIAIPAFEAVSNQELKNNNIVKYNLLKSYQNDIRDILNFISVAEKELSKPFSKNANEQLTELRTTSFYLNYQRYDDRSNTFLGKKIILMENCFKVFDGNAHKLNLESLKKELNICLKTIEDL